MSSAIVEKVRNNCPGFVGDKFAKAASDDDIIKMVELRNRHAYNYNLFMLPINKAIDELNKKYKITGV